jgi:ubiquinone/menaquinone biosynthesis C-methylase UbiE
MQYFSNSQYDINDPDLVSVYDDLPLWSAPFGLMLLEAVHYRPNLTVLDIGCGTGFPIIELAGRLGDTCCLAGIDPWPAGVDRAIQKIGLLELPNVEVREGTAENLPFKDGRFDLIVANNGINNVDDQGRALAECFRVARPGCQMVLTVNLIGTMIELYRIFEQTLLEAGQPETVERMKEHILTHRQPMPVLSGRIEAAGFGELKIEESSFTMSYTDGRAMLNHPFIKLAFLEAWKGVVAEKEVNDIFKRLEENLNAAAGSSGGLTMTVPMACISCWKR